MPIQPPRDHGDASVNHKKFNEKTEFHKAVKDKTCVKPSWVWVWEKLGWKPDTLNEKDPWVPKAPDAIVGTCRVKQCIDVECHRKNDYPCQGWLIAKKGPRDKQ